MACCKTDKKHSSKGNNFGYCRFAQIMNNTTLNIISVHLFFIDLPMELIDITHTWELYKGLMARWALNAPPVTGPSSTQPGV